MQEVLTVQHEDLSSHLQHPHHRWDQGHLWWGRGRTRDHGGSLARKYGQHSEFQLQGNYHVKKWDEGDRKGIQIQTLAPTCQISYICHTCSTKSLIYSVLNMKYLVMTVDILLLFGHFFLSGPFLSITLSNCVFSFFLSFSMCMCCCFSPLLACLLSKVRQKWRAWGLEGGEERRNLEEFGERE